MTPEQIDLEFTQMALDKKLQNEANGEKVYEDEDYEQYDNDTDSTDSMLSDISTHNNDNDKVEDEWEDI